MVVSCVLVFDILQIDISIFRLSFSFLCSILQFVKKIYADLPNTMVTLFEPGGAGSSDDAGGKSSSVSWQRARLITSGMNLLLNTNAPFF